MVVQNDPRRWRERQDGSMVTEDPYGPSNLSKNVMVKQIPSFSVAIDPHTGDTPNFGKPELSMSFFNVIKGK